MHWIIKNQLAAGKRPGYSGESGTQVSQNQVDSWISDVRESGVRSIICLLAEDQLGLYASLPLGLIDYYRDAGFAVAHAPARDHQQPPLTDADLEKIWEAYGVLPKPVLVHCSAGVDRTGMAVQYIAERAGHRP